MNSDQNAKENIISEPKLPALTIELSDDAAASFERGELAVPEGMSLERAFPEDSEFEERHRAFGLHRIYNVTIDESTTSTKAGENLLAIPGVLHAEPCPRAVPDAIPFNDPYANRQWHLYNDGSLNSKFVAGADLNVTPVWSEFTGGTNNVIVGVVDTGVQADHPDLANSVIAAGASGSKSFLNSASSNPYNITPQRHGTHVAGVIAAINNNGKGVCGIAGGKNGAGGVRILDCQAIAAVEGDGGNTNSAIVWAADHGAVILNNSWNFKYDNESSVPTTTSLTTRLAIDYFISTAGTDGKGNQTGPMKGGVVFFSAGNDSRTKSQPSMYDGNLSIGAIGPAGESSYYTNYGDWVDLCAPGGSASGYSNTTDPQVYSTMVGSSYYQMQGTSQASPCAAGVAALIVSYFGGPGFTPDRLKEILINGANTDIPMSHSRNIGPLVDAYGSFLYASNAPMPTAVADIEAVQTPEDDVNVSWTMNKYGKQNVYMNLLLMSKDASLLEDPDPFSLPSSVTVRRISGRSKTPGEWVTETFKGLNIGTDYYFTVVSYTARRYVTTDNTIVHIRPRKNAAPVVTPESYAPASLCHNDKKVFTFNYSDSDGDKLDITLSSGSAAAEWKDDGAGTLTLSIDGNGAPAGSYMATANVSDGIASQNRTVFYVIRPNEVPVIQQDGVMPGSFKYRDVASILLQCSDADEDELSVALVPGSPAAEWAQEGPGLYRLTVRGDSAPAGYYTASITLDDGFGGTASQNINYSLTGNHPTEILNGIGDQIISSGSTETLDLRDYFHDSDGDEITFSLLSFDGPLNAGLEGSVLSFSASKTGVGSIRVSATDGIAEPVEASFRVSAHSPGSKIAELYPTQVDDKLVVQGVSSSKLSIQIYNSTGRSVYSTSIKPDPYDPYVINVSGLAPGRYTVILTGPNSSVKKSIYKL
ncbi:MAG: S8 family serine peptidase [Bacteroidales bacterium]|nr:S8 family serine peptidase [Bacteroidales bacterium]